jgi:EpsI family protein
MATGRETSVVGMMKDSRAHFLDPKFIVVVVLLLGTLIASRTIEFREKVPIKKPLKELPAQVGEWTGERQAMEQIFLDTLTLSDYAMVDYADSRGRTVSFYTAYYESQRKRESIHSPETCLPGGGWIFREAGATDVGLGDGHAMRVNRAFMEKSGTKELTYYWFSMRGRVLTNLYQAKVYTFWDALTRHRTDGALVRFITPVYENEAFADAEARLQGFNRQIVPVLKEYIPE